MNTATKAGRGAYRKAHSSVIGRLRVKAGLTQLQAAALASVSLRTFQRAEAGDVCPLDVKRRIERSLGVAW